MGKNKNRNRRNKEKNKSSLENKALDVQVNISYSGNYSRAGGKKGLSLSAKCAVEDQEKCKIQDISHSLYLSDVNVKGISNANNSKNVKDAVSKVDTLKKDKSSKHLYNPCIQPANATSASTSLYTGTAQPLIESNNVKKALSNGSSNYAKFEEPDLEMKHSGKIRPVIETSYAKASTCAKDGNNIKKVSPLLTNNHIDKSEDSLKSNKNLQNKISLAPVATISGARPKTNPNQFRNSTLNNLNYSQNKDVDTFKQRIQHSVRKSENEWDRFERVFRTWKSERENTIRKLQELVVEVHKDQMLFNQGNVALKEWNVGSRGLKCVDVPPAVDFLASLAAFVTDAASSVTSVVQAFNVDKYAEMFKEIMDHDADITKPLYAARSQSLVEYRNVEEMIRQCHMVTFGNTIDNISNTLKVDDLWMDIKSAKGIAGPTIDSVGVFLQRNANKETWGEVCNSIQNYVDNNPAVLEACKSAGRALHGVCDTWVRDQKKGRASIANQMSIVTNNYFLMEQKRELELLRSIANDDDEDQAKLESDIHMAISSLKREMIEISNIFKERNQRSDSPWHF